MGYRIDLAGKTFGRWKILKYAGRAKTGSSLWKCRCNCGTVRIVYEQSLIRKRSKSCGCYLKEVTKKRSTIHGMSGSKYYKLWQIIKARCNNPKKECYERYGARGIKLHPAWNKNFKYFYDYIIKHLGPKPSPKHSIDRIDNDKGYIPDNLRWATISTQNFNTRKRKSLLKYQGVYTKRNKYRAMISYKNKSIGLGTFETEEEAVRAYNKAALKIHKQIPKCNIL